MRQRRKGFTLLHGGGKKSETSFPTKEQSSSSWQSCYTSMVLSAALLWVYWGIFQHSFKNVPFRQPSGISRPRGTGPVTSFRVRSSAAAVSGKISVDIRAE